MIDPIDEAVEREIDEIKAERKGRANAILSHAFLTAREMREKLK